MPRDLADVLHYFLPELDHESEASEAIPAPSIASPLQRTPAWPANTRLPLIGVPIGDRDVVRAALTWNLAVETARLGGRAIVLAPEADRETPLWPESGVGPLGTEVIFCDAHDLEELSACANDVAQHEAAGRPHQTGSIFVRVPTTWLAPKETHAHSIGWWLLISSPNHRDLSEAYELARLIGQADPGSRIGLTIHAVSKISEAKRAYEHLARRCATGLGFELASYGLLVDDLHVYRAIVAQRPIGLAHPQAPATLALMDVARLIAEDAMQLAVGP